MKADVKTLTEIEADPSAFGQAVTVIIIAGVASLIGNIFRSGIGAGIFGLITSIAGYALFSVFVYLIGTKVMPEPATHADFNQAFRTIGFAAAPGVFYILAVVPFLGPLISLVVWIWSLVIGVIAVREVLDYSNTGRAIIVSIVAGLACFIVLILILAPILAAIGIASAAVS